MFKPRSVRGLIKHQALGADRHAPTMPNDEAGSWARELTTTRVSVLFRTLPGLDGHWTQIQGLVNAGNSYFFTKTYFTDNISNDGGATSEEGKELIKWIANAVISAAEASPFDFPLKQLEFTRDLAWLKIQKTGGRLIIWSSPTGTAAYRAESSLPSPRT